MKNLNRILWGIVLVLLGIIWAINALGIADINIFFAGWWTLFIIVPCAIGLFDTNSSKVGNLLGLIIGIALLLGCRGIIDFATIWKLIVPTIIIGIGLSMIFGSVKNTKVVEKINGMESDSLEPIVATFGEQIVNKNNEKFNGANLDCVFGGITLNLTDAKLKDEMIIKASSIFGGINIIVPGDVDVKVKSTPIFGGVSNRRSNKEAKKVIYIDAFCLFGGIDIK